ncbi:MAG: alpha/beta hydrolase [Verrucomicrobia bacterium]|nr:alpha/beta hydrolase [Verrucomicrobiota bacterium]
MSRAEAERAVELLFADRRARLAAERKEEMEAKAITLGDKTLRWLAKTFGESPASGRSLWISMHGGGNAPPRVNDRQWQNQAGLYEPAEGIYVAPRAPTDTWNLWHEAHIDPLFQRLIDNHVALEGVDPDRVYLLGYSAGGDGVWQLAPRMADRFAAAAMMAGHPNEASLLGLRNLPFALFMGGNDAAYNRNQVATERAAELDRLAAADPGGYVHLARIYEGLGHWMNKQDAEALPWMAQFRRQPWPDKVVWQQDDVVHRRFYWLQLPEDLVIPDRQQFTAALGDGGDHADRRCAGRAGTAAVRPAGGSGPTADRAGRRSRGVPRKGRATGGRDPGFDRGASRRRLRRHGAARARHGAGGSPMTPAGSGIIDQSGPSGG